MYHLPTSYLFFFFFFFVFTLFHHLPRVSSKNELGWCEAKFQCGNITAGFPFSGGIRPQICGHPLLELHCFNNNTSIIISDHIYNVLHIDQKSNTLRLARAELEGSFCNATFTSTTLPSEIFELPSTYKSLTVFYLCDPNLSYRSSYTCPGRGPVLVSQNLDYQYSCQGSFTINVPKSFVPEEKELNLAHLESAQREGFEVKVKIDEKACQECSSSHGICSFKNNTQVCCKEFSSLGCNTLHPPDAQEHHILCSTPFSCGDQNDLSYPFWISGREDCGHPDFKLDCSGEFAEFSISSVKFRILNSTSRVTKLARSDYIGDFCPQNPPSALFNENILPFVHGTELLTIYYDCQDFANPPYVGELECDGVDRKSYYATSNLSSPFPRVINGLFCHSDISIPASGPSLNTLHNSLTPANLQKALQEGFEVGLNKECLMCMDSAGACGYNQTQTSSGFVCYCIDGAKNYTCGSRNKGLSTKAKAGIVVAASIAGVAILMVSGVFLHSRRRKKTQSAQYTSKDLPITSYSSKETSNDPMIQEDIVGRRKKTSNDPRRRTSEDSKQQYLKALIPLKHYSYVQLEKITNSFAEVVGKGGFGTVYRGILSDGRSVAVKILKESQGNGEDFINEVESMSKTSHVNIVTLLGFCSEGSKKAIVYEFMENGSLDKFISSKRSSDMDWRELYKIALGVARGLKYLHHGCRTRIIHFDIKPQNVLLDENLIPKVSDFGLAKLCERRESILSLLDTRGTIGYIAPELFSRMYGRVSHKSDVYSYGMLLFEMIGARNKPSTEDSASNPSSMYFPEWIYKDLENRDNGRLIENGINSEEEEIARKMTLVGLWCIQSSPSDRPPMDRVVEMMEGNLNALEVPPRPVFQIPAAPLQESSTISENILAYTEVCSINIA